MAKKNSTKTATKEAMQASVPKVQVFSKWTGINIADTSPGWTDAPADYGHRTAQTDLKPNFFLLQNNVDSLPNGTIETRKEAYEYLEPPEGYRFTGATHMDGPHFFAACEKPSGSSQSIWWVDVSKPTKTWKRIRTDGWVRVSPGDGSSAGSNVWRKVSPAVPDKSGFFPDEDGVYPWSTAYLPAGFKWTCIYTWVKNGDPWLICMSSDTDPWVQSTCWSCPLDYSGSMVLENARMITRPFHRESSDPDRFEQILVDYSTALQEHVVTDESNAAARISIWAAYYNKYGQTQLCHFPKTIMIDISPTEFNARHWMDVSCILPKPTEGPVNDGESIAYPWTKTDSKGDVVPDGIDGVVFYYTVNNAETPNFMCKAAFDDGEWDQESLMFTARWGGGQENASEWVNSPLEVSTDNLTLGPPCSMVRCHDGRLYFWGNRRRKYRLYIGGNSGVELSHDTAFGGGFVDIEAGTGLVVHGTAKFKTSGGNDIITILCGNENTSEVKRFNLNQDSLSFTSENSVPFFMAEEVQNTVGCNSDYGYGSFADGLYVVDRYGLGVTTMQMEYSSQMRTTFVSDAVFPVFEERLAEMFSDARMVYVNGIVYIALSNSDRQLDHVVFCYSTATKAWWTYTIGGEDDEIIHMMNIDWVGGVEGLGVVFRDKIMMMPTTGDDGGCVRYIVETPELAGSIPTQGTLHVSQLELRFDYFVGLMTVEVEGVDYYGRRVMITKSFSADEQQNDFIEWIRVDLPIENYRIRMTGDARFRLTHVIAKVYTLSSQVGQVYGFDSRSRYFDRKGGYRYIHHRVDSYNNLKEAIIP